MKLIEKFWKTMQARDWSSFEKLLDDDFSSEYPQSGEVFTKENYIAMNKFYPGDWNIEVHRIVISPDCVISEIHVALDGKIDYGVGFFTIEEYKVKRLREFWAEPFPVPKWRQELLTNKSIK